MAGRTLRQQAVPTTFGLQGGRLAGRAWRGARDAARGRAALPAQLGGAAGTLAALGTAGLRRCSPIRGRARAGRARAALAHAAARRSPSWARRWPCVAGALGKIARDVVLLAQTEVGEVAEPAAPGRGGSSAMPHKRNPVGAIRSGRGAPVPAARRVLLEAMAGEHERAAGAGTASGRR